MSLFSRSILARVLSVVLAANLLVAICALLYFSHSLSSNREYHALASDQMVNALEAEDILNQFKTQLADQLQNGVYLTERKQVEIEQTDLAPVGADQDSSTGAGRAPKLVKAKQLVWKTVPVLGLGIASI